MKLNSPELLYGWRDHLDLIVSEIQPFQIWTIGEEEIRKYCQLVALQIQILQINQKYSVGCCMANTSVVCLTSKSGDQHKSLGTSVKFFLLKSKVWAVVAESDVHKLGVAYVAILHFLIFPPKLLSTMATNKIRP